MGCGASTNSTSSGHATAKENSTLNAQNAESTGAPANNRERSPQQHDAKTSSASSRGGAPLPPSLVALRMARESNASGGGTPLQDSSFKSDPFRTSSASDDHSLSSGTDDLGRPPPSRASTQRFETSISSQSLESSYQEQHVHHGSASSGLGGGTSQQQNLNAVFGLNSLTGSLTSRRSDIGPSTSPPPPEDPHAVFIEDDLRARGSGDQSNTGADRNPLVASGATPSSTTTAPVKVIIVPEVRDPQPEGRLSLKERWHHCVRRFPLPERPKASSFGSDSENSIGNSPIRGPLQVTSPTQGSAQAEFGKTAGSSQHRQELAKLFEQFDVARKKRLTIADLDSGLRRKLALDRVQPHLNLVAIEHSAINCILQLKATVPPVGVIAPGPGVTSTPGTVPSGSSSDELDFRINLTEFRYILLYIRNWFDVFVRLEEVDGSAERRVDLEEFQRLVRVLESEWGTSLLGQTSNDPAGGAVYDAFLECSGKEFDALDTQRCGFVLVESVADWVAKKDLAAHFDPLDEAY